MSATIIQVEDLDNYAIKEIPPSVHYIPDFITEEEENFLLDHIYRAPKPKWTQLSHRKLQNWGGLPHSKGMVTEAIPDWLQRYMDRINLFEIFDVDKKPNHVLVNEYLPGQGIMPHVDGPLFTPIITTISLSSHTVLDFYHKINADDEDQSFDYKDRYHSSILLMPRSLVVIQEDMYHKFLHGIKEIEEDKITSSVINHKAVGIKKQAVLKRNKRVSLTIRHVPKTIKVQLKMGKWFKNT